MSWVHLESTPGRRWRPRSCSQGSNTLRTSGTTGPRGCDAWPRWNTVWWPSEINWGAPPQPCMHARVARTSVNTVRETGDFCFSEDVPGSTECYSQTDAPSDAAGSRENLSDPTREPQEGEADGGYCRQSYTWSGVHEALGRGFSNIVLSGHPTLCHQENGCQQ